MSVLYKSVDFNFRTISSPIEHDRDQAKLKWIYIYISRCSLSQIASVRQVVNEALTSTVSQAVNFWKILVLNDEHTERKYVFYFLIGWGECSTWMCMLGREHRCMLGRWMQVHAG